MKDVYGRPIYRLERVRGNQARYQNSETGQWTSWVRPHKSEFGFPDKLNQTDMGMLLYQRLMRRGMRRVTEGMQLFAMTVRSIGEKMKLEHPEVLTASLDAAIARHPATLAKKQLAGMHLYHGGPPVQEFDLETTDEEVQHRIALMGDDDITDDEITRAGAQADHPGLADIVELPLPKNGQRTKEQLDREERLSSYTVAELRQAIRELPYVDKMKAPGGGFSKMRKAELITWIVDNDLEEDTDV